MAYRNVLVWNVRTFGSFEDQQKGPEGSKRISGTLSFIATLITDFNIDVFVMQEFMKDGKEYLADLLTFIKDKDKDDAKWSYDYVPGSIKMFSDVESIKSLDYTVRGHNEGYAVFWKGEILAPFAPPEKKMSFGRNGDDEDDGYINLIVKGSNPAFFYDDKDGIKIKPDGNGFDKNARFPRPGPPPIRNDSTDRLANEAALDFYLVRHPCHVRLAKSDIDVIVYHAPNEAPAPVYGALAMTLMKEVGENKARKVVFAGDFNMTNEKDFESVVKASGDYDFNMGVRCARKGVSKFGFYRTQIQFLEIGKKDPQLLYNNEVYEYPRDILCYRNNILTPQPSVIDPVRSLMDQNDSLSKKIFEDPCIRNSVKQAEVGLEKYRFDKRIIGDKDLLAQITDPFEGDKPACFPNLLASACFYRSLVTDHLPLYFSFQV